MRVRDHILATRKKDHGKWKTRGKCKDENHSELEVACRCELRIDVDGPSRKALERSREHRRSILILVEVSPRSDLRSEAKATRNCSLSSVYRHGFQMGELQKGRCKASFLFSLCIPAALLILTRRAAPKASVNRLFSGNACSMTRRSAATTLF